MRLIRGIASSSSTRLIHMLSHSSFTPIEAPLQSLTFLLSSNQVIRDSGSTPLDHVFDPPLEVLVLEPNFPREGIACAARVAVPAKEACLEYVRE